jgi:putative ABC transport system permease protein
MILELLSRITAGWRRRDLEREAADELAFHVEMQAEENARRGMTPVEARRAALRSLGGIEQLRERVRDTRTTWLDSIWSDLRYAARLLRRSPAFTAAALVTLGIGIGATTAVFSVADAVAFRPLPYREPDRLFSVHARSSRDNRVSTGVSSRDFLFWRDHQQVFDGVAAIGGGSFRLVEGEPEVLRGCRVSADLFPTLGARPLAGRIFGREHEVVGRHQVALLSHAFWQRRFAADPDIIGRALHLDEGTYEVVGVMPEDFKYPPAGRPYDLWVPLAFDAETRLDGSPYLGTVLRLKEGATPAQAAAHLEGLSARLEPVAGITWRPFLVPYREVEVGKSRGWMALLLGAAVLVLLVACANTAHLVLAQASGRSREMAVRAALGGGRGRLIRQLATESLFLSSLATLAGIALAWAAVRVLAAAAPSSLRSLGPMAIDGRVLAFAVGTGAATGLACAVVPALRAARRGVTAGLREGGLAASAGRGGRRFRETLAFTEIALSFVLLAGASLFILSFSRLMAVDPGFDTRNVVTLQASVPEAVNESGRGLADLTAIVDRVKSVPGVSGAAVITGGWMFGGGRHMYPAHKPGEPRPSGDQHLGDEVWVTPGLFRALGVRLLRGRDVSGRDTASSPPVLLVNETAARRYWPGEDPIGRQLVIVNRVYEVVGLVSDIAHLGTDPGPRPELYMALAQKQGAVYGSIVLRTRVKPAEVMPGVRRAVRSVWPQQPITRLGTLDEDVARAAAPRRFNMLLMSVFGVLALVIAVSGLAGVMACSVQQRRREMAIRLALGARGDQVSRAVLARGGAIVSMGVAAGACGAWALGRVVQAYLFEVEARDPSILAAVGFLLGAVGLAACWPPARRASLVDPVTALKAE